VSALHSVRAVAAVAVLLTAPTVALAQARSAPPLRTDPKPASNARESKSAVLAAELTQLLESKSLTNIAAPQADTWVGALYMPGVQLVVVGGKFPSENRMAYLLEHKSYKEAYQDLNGASEKGSKILITDLGAKGLHFKPDKDQPFDMVDVAGKSVAFDGKWGGKESVSREEYAKLYETTDERYVQMLQALIEQLKK
jgi:hypothetical protein